MYNVQIDGSCKRKSTFGNIYGLTQYQFYIKASGTTREDILKFFKEKMVEYGQPNYSIYVSYKPIESTITQSFDDIEKEIFR